MSSGNPPFPSRNVYSQSSKLPDRTASRQGQQPTFSHSTLGRRPDQSYAFAPATTAQQQHAAPGARPGMEKESNALSELSEEQREEINEAFSLFDLDRDRHLDYHELRVALRSLGFTVPKPEVFQIMVTHGVPKPQFKRQQSQGRNQQNYHASQLLLPQVTFQRIAATKIFERDPREEVERALLLFDPEQRGYIEVEDLRRVARELGETGLEDDEIQAMIEEYDYDGSGSCSREAFFTICLN